MSICHCDYCVDGRLARQAYRHGGIDDGWEETPYKKPSRSNWNGRKKRPCKKSKTKEPCDFSVTITLRSFYGWGEVWHNQTVDTCSRCGKYGQYHFFTTKEPIQ